MTGSIHRLVFDLPECYQPIYGHPELSLAPSRLCKDRLPILALLVAELKRVLGRPVRILDLGCAQGFFCFSLAEEEAQVTGVDFLDKNIAVCNAIKEQHYELSVSFVCERLETFIPRMESDSYDFVLGLSVFHHLVHIHGLEFVRNLLAILSRKVLVGAFEVALPSEPLYWGPSQPENPEDLLAAFSFVFRAAAFKTHLSRIERPLFIVSNSMAYLGGRWG